MDVETEAAEEGASLLIDPQAITSAWDAESIENLFQALAALNVTGAFIVAALLLIAGLIAASIFTRRLMA